MDCIKYAEASNNTVESVAGEMGCPRYNIEEERFLEINLFLDGITQLLGITASTVSTWIREYDCYTTQS